jgi:divalent metal cation (Fe/Co/Zn/Cd) transporter
MTFATEGAHPRLSPERNRVLRRAISIERWTIVVLATTVTAMYLAAGDSRAMKTALWEDLLSFVPSLVFLLGLPIEKKPASRDYPLDWKIDHVIVSPTLPAARASPPMV